MNRMKPSWRYSFLLEEIHVVEEVTIAPCTPAKHPKCFAAKWVPLLLREVLYIILKILKATVWNTGGVWYGKPICVHVILFQPSWFVHLAMSSCCVPTQPFSPVFAYLTTGSYWLGKWKNYTETVCVGRIQREASYWIYQQWLWVRALLLRNVPLLVSMKYKYLALGICYQSGHFLK